MFDEYQATDTTIHEKQDYEIIYDRLLTQFDHKHVIPLDVAGETIGFTRGTSLVMLSAGRFPIPHVKIGKRNYVILLVLAKFLADPLKMSTVPPVRCPGRPRKGEGPKEIAALLAKKKKESEK